MRTKQLSALVITVSAVLLVAGVCNGSPGVTIAWNPSLTDVNGKPITVTTGYKLYYSNSSGVYSQYIEVGSSTSADVTGLEYNKPYFFRAKAYTASGESAYSEELAWIAPAMPDTDTDGISDNWEMDHFGNLEVAKNSTDFDKDGSLDLAEFLAGTNPTDPLEYPSLAMNAAPAGATLLFEAKQAAGAGYENRSRYYTLTQCTDLAAGIWTGVPGSENILASNQLVSINVAPSGQKTFYRTKIQLN